ncbi:MAG: hypothetical protein RLZZ204_1175, partial [Bacteroidota bacterium]
EPTTLATAPSTMKKHHRLQYHPAKKYTNALAAVRVVMPLAS